MPYYGEEDDYYDYERDRRARRPSPHRYRSGGQMLSPHYEGAGLHRSRSQGHAPVPVVNVYNDMMQDGHFRNSSRSPPYSPRSEYRGRVGSDDLVEEVERLAIANDRLARSRSRSRGRSDASALPRRPDDYYEWELREKERQLRELEAKEAHEAEERRMKDKFELQRIKDEEKRKADEAARKAAEKHAVEAYEKKLQDEKEERKRLREQFEREEREEKERHKREEEEWARKLKEKEEKKKAEAKAEKERLEEEMIERLVKNGYTYAQAKRMIDDKKDDPVNRTTTLTTTTTRQFGDASYRPTFIKIKKEFLSIDTLRYYDIPFESDRDDDKYWLIFREMDSYETDVLFAHTKRLRAGKLLLEPGKKEAKYQWVRKRDRSTSRVRMLGIERTSK